MTNAKIAEMLLDYDNKISNSDEQIKVIDEQVQELQDQQDALSNTLNIIEKEISEYLKPKGNWMFKHSNYYMGKLNKDANISDWQVFNILRTDIKYVNDTTFSIIGNNQQSFSTGTSIYFKGATILYPIPHGTINSTSYDQALDKTYITMDMDMRLIPDNLEALIKLVYEINGPNWDNPKFINDRISDFDFTNDYIHQPLGPGGSYGTKDKMEKLKIAKALTQADKDKYIQAKDSLSRFSK